jgi:tetratricopeptide (TPR) repeat protein
MQILREAEGYLDLIIAFSDQWPLDAKLRDRLAMRALDALQSLPTCTGQRANILYLTGQAYRAMERYREAIPPLESASVLDPDNLLIWLALGWCYKRTSRLDLAIQSLEKGCDAAPDEAIVHYNLACYWSLAGKTKRAIRYLAKSFDIDASYRELVAGESDFDPIRDQPDFQSLTSALA